MAAKNPSWEDRAKRLLKTELARADIGYRELAERLKKHGMKETEASIANKISRGTFSATFLLASLKAIEADTLRLESV
jgi:hypothetical protein